MKINPVHIFSLLAAIGVTSVVGAEAIVPNLKEISQGIGGRPTPKVTVRWEADIKGKAALFTTGVVWLDGISFAEGKRLPRALGYGDSCMRDV